MTNTDANFIKSFLAGTSHTSYDYFGVQRNGDDFIFRVFAPKATQVMLVGDFNDWQDDISLNRVDESGVWEIAIPSDKISYNNRYKYRIYGCGQLYYKSDPYAVALSQSPDSSSVICDRQRYKWKDSGWLLYRKKYQKRIPEQPVNIYELHLNSWKSRGRGAPLNYTDYARELAPYVKQMGYTHICLLPLNEFYDGDKSHYVPSALFAPTSKYGKTDDLKAFVDKLHEAGVGVMFDIPIVAFLKEKYKLFEVNGGMFYGRVDNERIKHFDLTKGSVRSLLLSSISYWINEYHADAIKISAVDELLSLYSDEGNGTNIAKDFLKGLVEVLKKNYPDVLLISEGSDNDIEFDLSFNEIWSGASLDYVSTDYSQRTKKTKALARLLENNTSATLSVGHVDLSCQRKTLIEASTGDYWQKFAGLRALWGLMMTSQGKKLSFMGNEIAQFKPWSFEDETEWFLLDYESHEKLQRYIAELNHFYLAHPALWQCDNSKDSIFFIGRENFEQNIMIFRRSSKKEELIVVVNLSPNSFDSFRIGSYREGELVEIFNSDELKYYGSGFTNSEKIQTEKIEYHGCQSSFAMKIPPLSISILTYKK